MGGVEVRELGLVLTFESRANRVGRGLHLFGGELQFGFAEVHIALVVEGDEVQVGVRHFKADGRHADFATRQRFADGLRHALGETVVGGERFVVEVEDIVHLAARNHQGVAFCHGIDVEKRVEVFVFRAFIGRDFAGGDFTENSHGVPVFVVESRRRKRGRTAFSQIY